MDQVPSSHIPANLYGEQQAFTKYSKLARATVKVIVLRMTTDDVSVGSMVLGMHIFVSDRNKCFIYYLAHTSNITVCILYFYSLSYHSDG